MRTLSILLVPLILACKPPAADPTTLIVHAHQMDNQRVVSAAEGAVVALDDGAGVRHTLQADADGLAEFEVDWDLGAVDVTASIEHGDTWRSLTDIPADTQDLHVYVGVVGTPTTHVLSGDLLNRTPDTTVLVMSQDLLNEFDQHEGAHYEILVHGDQPVELLAAEFTYAEDEDGFVQEFHSWRHIELDPITADTAHDIDMAGEQAASVEVTGHFAIPDKIAEDTNIYHPVQVSQGRCLASPVIGFWTSVQLQDKRTRADFSAEFVDLGGEPHISLEVGAQGRWTTRCVPASTTDWDAVLPLLQVPEMIPLGGSFEEGLVASFVPADDGAYRCVYLSWGEPEQRWASCSMSSDTVRFPPTLDVWEGQLPASVTVMPLLVEAETPEWHVHGYDALASGFVNVWPW